MKALAHLGSAAIFAILFSLGTFTAPAFAAEEVTCECLESTCGKCEMETGVDFYTEKCGRGNSKVKSCKRPQCKAVVDYEVCLAKNEPAKPAARAVASATEVAPPPRSAEVILALGKMHLERGDAKMELVDKMKVYAGDRIVTAEDGRVRLRFLDLSEVFVSPQSSLLIADASVDKHSRGSKRMILLDLQKGRVRSRVQGNYNDGESKFEVKTRSAVAGVRGTEFTVSYEQSDAQWKTEVRTLHGEVSLDGRGGDKENNHATVFGGTYAAHIIPAPPSGSSPDELEKALSRGYVSPVFKMSEKDLKVFDDRRFSMNLSHDADVTERTPSSQASEVLCKTPMGAFNQCSWTCEGNPKGSKSCRSDLSNVKCVRRLCRASGEWAEPTVLPIKEGSSCDASGKAIVGDCGGYW